MPCCNTAQYKRLQRVLRHPWRVIQPTPQNSVQGFTWDFPAICRVLLLLCGVASDYTAPPAPRWSVSQRRNASTDTRYHRQALTRCQQYRPGSPAKGSASPPVQGQPGTLHPAGQSSSRGTAGGAEPLTATAVSLFGLSPDSQ